MCIKASHRHTQPFCYADPDSLTMVFLYCVPCIGIDLTERTSCIIAIKRRARTNGFTSSHQALCRQYYRTKLIRRHFKAAVAHIEHLIVIRPKCLTRPCCPDRMSVTGHDEDQIQGVSRCPKASPLSPRNHTSRLTNNATFIGLFQMTAQVSINCEEVGNRF